MEILLGFLIATAIGLTGVGAGIITAPLLIVFFHLPVAQSVGTSLAFGAVVKLLAAPVYLYRKQVNFRVLGIFLAGGLPGALAGCIALRCLAPIASGTVLTAAIGLIILVTALLNLCFSNHEGAKRRDYTAWMPLIAIPIGAEVGFSSAGAGALGSLAMLSFTSLTAVEVVGTDLFFGLGLSGVASVFHLASGSYDPGILWKLIVGGIFGAFAGVNLASFLPKRPLRVALTLWLASIGAQLCWQAVR